MHDACFDRILLDARIPAFMDAARAMGFFTQRRGLFPVRKNHIVGIIKAREPGRILTATGSPGCSTHQESKLNSLRYDLSKLRARQLAEKIPRPRRYQFNGRGYRLSIVCLKQFERLYAPLTARVIHPCSHDGLLALRRTTAQDQLYLAVQQALDNLASGIGLEGAA